MERARAEAFVVEKTALGEVADFRALDGYSADDKPVIPASFLRRLLLGQIGDARILRPGVRVWGAKIDGVLDLNDCGGDGLPALDLSVCDFTEAIHLSTSRLARLSVRGSKLRALVGRGLRVDGDFIFAAVESTLEDGIAFIDLQNAHITGNLNGTQAKLKALPRERDPNYTFTDSALDLLYCRIEGAALLTALTIDAGGMRLYGAQIGGVLQCDQARLVKGVDMALNGVMTRIGGAVLIEDRFSADGEVSFNSATIGSNLQCTNGTFKNAEGYALNADGAHISGSVLLDNDFSATGNISLVSAQIDGSLSCAKAHFSNEGKNALSAEDARIKGSVTLSKVDSAGDVNFLGADIRGNLFIGASNFKLRDKYALGLQGVHIAGSLQASTNTIEGAVNLSGARVGRLYDDPENAWAGASIIDLNELRYDLIATDPWFYDDESPTKLRRWMPPNAKRRHSKLWQARTAWLKRNTGTLGEVKLSFSNQPWRECASALASAGHLGDARRVAREEQREVNRRRDFWKQPIVWLCAEVPFGFGLSAVRATVTSLLLWAIGWLGVSLMLERGALLDSRSLPHAVVACSAITPGVYALDAAVPLLDLRQESVCEPGFVDAAPIIVQANAPLLGAFTLDELTLWRFAKAMYAAVCAIVLGITLLTYSGIFKPKAD
jgi:hypothetical protein